MAGLLKEIKDLYPDVARELEKAEFRSDDEIRTLTREDLHELLRGPKKLKQRKAVYELIHQQKPIGDLLKDLKDVIPAESLKAALTENGVLSGYLQIMKDLTSQVGKVQSFLQEHVSLLEEHSYKAAKVPRTGSKAQKGTHPGSNVQKGSNRPPTQTGFGQAKVVPSSSSPESGQRDGFDLRSDTYPDPHPSNVDPDEPLGAHKAQPVAEVSSSVSTEQMRKTEKLPTLTFLSIVSGDTFKYENIILDRLRSRGKMILVNTEDSPKLLIVFCKIESEFDADCLAIRMSIPESLFDTPVILVMMHHTMKHNKGLIQKPGPSLKKWNIVLVVNIFYHVTLRGLLIGDMNNQAVNQMHTLLLKYCGKSICDKCQR
ncbi:uncharacterized protein LOC130374154 isoform X3 [Gadus chalcogrammus]|uniref:uncharacterized protein LOC130374154 isoform X3 n=1 Tax=Gadus chalcogrammus TaxID=1042646 RepID=UPI0024C490EE|nr:uncharacterized protein LOC130374154 isoform X3 [Gadus chalcogrammus]